MVAVGLDIGARTVKVVAVADKRVIASSVVLSGLERRESSKQALQEALQKASLSPQDVARTVVTGSGQKEVGFSATEVSGIIAAARGAAAIFPSVRTVIDIGAEESHIVRCQAGGKVTNFVTNEKCSAGVGAFIESMARALETDVTDLGEMSLRSQREIAINATCTIFAETEVVSLIHSNVAKPDIARAIHNAIATRIASMASRIGIEDDVALIGGLARNVGIVNCLEKHLGHEVLVSPDPEIIIALGAALLAEESSGAT